MSNDNVSVVIVDDHDSARFTIKCVLEARPGISIVGEATTGKEALAQVAQHQPDLVTMDVAMPDASGLELAEKILKEKPATSIFLITGHYSKALVHHALRLGVTAFISKVNVCTSIRDALEAAGRGDVYVDPDVKVRLKLRPKDLEHKSPLESLSKREREILERVVVGETSAGIAEELGISVKSVNSYRSRLMAKIGAGNITGLVKFAITHGLAQSNPAD